MLLVSALYPNAPGGRFDGEYYLAEHAPFAARLLGPHGLKSVRVALGRSALDGGPPPFWAICEMLFDSRESFDAAMAAKGAELMADAPNYTDVSPILQISELLQEA